MGTSVRSNIPTLKEQVHPAEENVAAKARAQTLAPRNRMPKAKEKAEAKARAAGVLRRRIESFPRTMRSSRSVEELRLQAKLMRSHAGLG